MKSLCLLLALSFSFSALAQDIFVVKKSKRILNVLHFKANVDKCNFKSPPVKNNWVMGEEEGHEEQLSSQERPYFTPKFSYVSDTEATFTMGALEKMQKKFKVKEINVRLVNCKPKAYIELQDQEVQIQEIFVQVNALMMPLNVTVKGKYADGSPAAVKLE